MQNPEQSLFDIVKPDFFSLLASKNKRIYFRALMVLQSCYQQELQIRRTDLVAYLMHQMEEELYQWSMDAEETEGTEDAGTFQVGGTAETTGGRLTLSANRAANAQNWDVSEADLNTLSGRAHALVRRLVQTGWLEVMPDESSLDELLLVPDYASQLLEVFDRIVHPEEKKYNAYVYATYSSLRTANEEREYMYQALQSAYDNTRALLESLKGLLHNIHKFYQNLQKQTEVRHLLAEHFDEYQVLVATKTYHPLKTVDSVHRFRPRILDMLRNWLTDEEVLSQIVLSMNPGGGDGEARSDEARYEAIRRMQFIIDSFDSMDSILREIDRRNTSYNRASVERIQYLLNSDRDLKGKLVSILRRAPKLEVATPSRLGVEMARLPVYQVRTADPDALYTERQRRVRGKPQPLNLHEETPAALFAAEAEQLMERAQSLLSDEQIIRFLLQQMSDNGVLETKDMHLNDVEDYLRTLVAVIKSDEASFPFDLEWDEGTHTVMVNGYGIPAMRFLKTGVV